MRLRLGRTALDNNSPILDYASPRKRLKLRLPARSTLYCNIWSDQIVLTETLAAKEGVFPGLIFTVLMQAISLFLIIGSANGIWRIINSLGIVPLGLMALQIPLMLVVIHQTWRKTVLIVRHNQLKLSFTSPLQRQHYQWTGAEIAGMLLVETANTRTELPLAELLITRCSGGEIHLFTDHPAGQIQRLITILPPMLREGVHPNDNPQIFPWTQPK